MLDLDVPEAELTARRARRGCAAPRGVTLPSNQNVFLRARGFFSTGQYNGSGSTVASPAVPVDTAYETTTDLTAPYEAWVGGAITLTATVTPSGTTDLPTGTITFLADGATIENCGAQPLTNGQATCTA